MTSKKENPKKNGRPSKFKPEYCELLVSFCDIAPWIAKDMTITKSDGTQIDKTELEPSDMPFYIDFCKKIGIDYSTFENWKAKENVEKYPGFFRAYQKAEKLREKILVQNGLRGLYSPAFAIFTAKNLFGWRDRSEVDLGAKDSLLEAYKDMKADDLIKATTELAKEILRTSGGNKAQETSKPS